MDLDCSDLFDHGVPIQPVGEKEEWQTGGKSKVVIKTYGAS